MTFSVWTAQYFSAAFTTRSSRYRYAPWRTPSPIHPDGLNDRDRTPPRGRRLPFFASCLVAHEAFKFAGRPGQRILQRLTFEVADRHLGLDGLGVDLLSELV